LLSTVQLRSIVRVGMKTTRYGLALYDTDIVDEGEEVILVLVFRLEHVVLNTTFTETIYTIYPDGYIEKATITRSFKK
jgi:hypothetical protein